MPIDTRLLIYVYFIVSCDVRERRYAFDYLPLAVCVMLLLPVAAFLLLLAMFADTPPCHALLDRYRFLASPATPPVSYSLTRAAALYRYRDAA